MREMKKTQPHRFFLQPPLSNHDLHHREPRSVMVLTNHVKLRLQYTRSARDRLDVTRVILSNFPNIFPLFR